VYPVLLARPDTVIVVLLVVAVNEPGDDVAVYCTGCPPAVPGATTTVIAPLSYALPVPTSVTEVIVGVSDGALIGAHTLLIV